MSIENGPGPSEQEMANAPTELSEEDYQRYFVGDSGGLGPTNYLVEHGFKPGDGDTLSLRRANGEIVKVATSENEFGVVSAVRPRGIEHFDEMMPIDVSDEEKDRYFGENGMGLVAFIDAHHLKPEPGTNIFKLRFSDGQTSLKTDVRHWENQEQTTPEVEPPGGTTENVGQPDRSSAESGGR